MVMDKESILDQPLEASWSESTTPVEDEVEEINRREPPRHSGDSRLASFARGYRPVRKRHHKGIDKYNGVQLQRSQIMTFPMLDLRRSMEDSESSSSQMTVITSAGSSCTDPWSSSGFVEDEEDEGWDRDEDTRDGSIRIGDVQDGKMPVTKLEPEDDDVNMADLREPSAEDTPSVASNPITAKRPRGRPRKHPKLEAVAKVMKGRSKTGCITCRRRKKKCDERKPGCLNCEKNAVDCEGYPPKTIWKSGKEKAEEARLRRVSLPNIKLPALINGVETPGDRIFFEHYIYRLSTIFTVEGEANNAFKGMLLPMAIQHPGLMHSILALSSRHIDYRSPYGLKFLRDHPDVNVKVLEERSRFHSEEATKELSADIERQMQSDKPLQTLPTTFGQMLCLVLETLSDPKPKGQHRIHLDAYQRLIQQCPPEDGDFLKFIHEFFQYHIAADELIALPRKGTSRLTATSDDWNLPTTIVQPDAVRLLGVSDGLFLYMSKITNIRNEIRENLQNGIDPPVGYNSLFQAALIDAGIREWKAAWPAGDSRDLAGLLYKQMMWVYLWRTIHPPRSTSWEPNPKITEAVNGGIEILSSFDPRDPSQTLILAPAFVLGCSAFEPSQRDPIRKAIGIVKSYMEYKNSDTALEVLEEVWRLMDKKDERSWDWQSIAHGMGMDFLAT